MDKFKYVISFVAFFVLFLLLLFYFFPSQRVVRVVENMATQQNLYSGQNIINQLTVNFKNVNNVIPDFYLYTVDGDSVSVSSFFQKSNKTWLVCRFSDDYCSSCVEKSIDLVLADSCILPDNVLFLGYCGKGRVLKKRIEQYRLINYKCFMTPRFILPIDDLSCPYYFVIDNQLTVKGVYLPTQFEDQTDSISLNLLYKTFIK